MGESLAHKEAPFLFALHKRFHSFYSTFVGQKGGVGYVCVVGQRAPWKLKKRTFSNFPQEAAVLAMRK